MSVEIEQGTKHKAQKMWMNWQSSELEASLDSATVLQGLCSEK